jgi:hypothetical protein
MNKGIAPLFTWFKPVMLLLHQFSLSFINCSNKYNIFHIKMEILGLDPKITICKIAVLPIKLYPL